VQRPATKVFALRQKIIYEECPDTALYPDLLTGRPPARRNIIYTFKISTSAPAPSQFAGGGLCHRPPRRRTCDRGACLLRWEVFRCVAPACKSAPPPVACELEKKDKRKKINSRRKMAGAAGCRLSPTAQINCKYIYIAGCTRLYVL